MVRSVRKKEARNNNYDRIIIRMRTIMIILKRKNRIRKFVAKGYHSKSSRHVVWIIDKRQRQTLQWNETSVY